MLNALRDLFFPPCCTACDSPGIPFCPECAAQAVVLRRPGCRRCGRPLEWDVGSCADCPPKTITWSRSAFLYRDPVRRALLRVKFAGLRSLIEAFGPAVAESLADAPLAEGAVLTWVPLGRRRKRGRGFDQAEALCRAVGREARLPVRSMLVRTTETQPQATLRGRDRARAIAGSFASIGPTPAVVVLVDDVLTTAATAAACAAILRVAGAREVGLLTVARSLGGPLPARCYNSARPASTDRGTAGSRCSSPIASDGRDGEQRWTS